MAERNADGAFIWNGIEVRVACVAFLLVLLGFHEFGFLVLVASMLIGARSISELFLNFAAVFIAAPVLFHLFTTSWRR